MFQCHSITCSYPVFLTPFIKKTLLSPLFCILSFIGQKLVVVVYLLSRVQLLGPHWQWPARLLCPWDSPDNTGVGCHFSPQGIFPTQGSNPGLLICRQILYHLNYKESIKRPQMFYSFLCFTSLIVEKEMATRSSTLAWKIPWTGEPGRLGPWGCKESDMTERLHFHFH